MSLVIDCSFILGWCLQDTHNAKIQRAMAAVVNSTIFVPWIWWYEVRNALLVNERRNKIKESFAQATLSDLEKFDIQIDQNLNDNLVFSLARVHQLTFYDAAYLELAKRISKPLCTLDKQLIKAAKKANVEVL